LKDGQRISPQPPRERLPHQIGADKGAVEVNDERNVLGCGHVAGMLAEYLGLWQDFN
jgi:hypothetical protein